MMSELGADAEVPWRRGPIELLLLVLPLARVQQCNSRWLRRKSSRASCHIPSIVTPREEDITAIAIVYENILVVSYIRPAGDRYHNSLPTKCQFHNVELKCHRPAVNEFVLCGVLSIRKFNSRIEWKIQGDMDFQNGNRPNFKNRQIGTIRIRKNTFRLKTPTKRVLRERRGSSFQKFRQKRAKSL